MKLAQLALVTTASAVIVVFAVFALGVVGGLAGERCTYTTASWYGQESCHRTPCRTADGSIFTGAGLTAAMPSRKHLGEHWRVTYRGRSVVVLVNDIGPRADLHRGIDLSRAAARAIGFTGIGRVCLERIG